MPIRRLRIRLIAAPVLLALALPAGTARGQGEEPLLGAPAGADAAANFYEQALVAHNMGEMRTAYIYLKNALREDPLLLPAHLLLGKVYLYLGQGERAEKQLLIADGLGAHRSLIQNSLARAYLMQGRPEQLVDELFPVGTAPDEDAELMALRGEALLELGRYFDAQRAFTQAWETNPRSVAAILGRVRVLLLQGKIDEATALVRDAVEIAPTNARAWHLKGALAYALGDLSGALSDYEQAAELLPAYLPAQIGRIGVLLRLNRLDQAAEVADELRSIYPNDPRSYYLEAVVQTRLGDEQIAETALTNAYNLISRFPRELIEGHRPTLLLAGIVSFNLKQWEQALTHLELYLSADPDSTGVRVLLARIELEQHDRPERAILLLEPAVERTPGNIEALSLLAEAYMRTGQHLRAAQRLREAMERKRDDIVLRTQRAVNEFGLGRRGKAIAELATVFERRPDLRSAGATLVVMQLQERDFDAAVASARTLMLDNPENLTYCNLHAAALLSAERIDAARWGFERILTMDPSFFPARHNLAELLLGQRQTQAARSHLERILDHHEDETGTLLLLARTYEADGDLDRALEFSQRALGSDPASIEVAVYQSGLLLKMRRTEEAVRVAEGVEVRARNPDNVELLTALSRAYIASGRRATAQIVLRRSSSLAGYNARELLTIAKLQRDAGDLDGAVWSLQKAAEGEPSFLPARMLLGEMLVERGRLGDAAAAAETLARDFPAAPYADHLMGLIHQARDEHDAALASFRKAMSRKPSALLAIRVYQVQRDVEGLEAAVKALEAWQSEHPEDAIIGQTLAQGYRELGRTDEARDLFEATLEQAPDNPVLLNNLAVIYAETDDPRALDYARRAHELLPQSPQVADTLGWILVKQGDTLEGLRHLRDAKSRSANDPGISYHIAVALQALGRTAEAIDELVEALRNSDADYGEHERASRLLAELQEAASS